MFRTRVSLRMFNVSRKLVMTNKRFIHTTDKNLVDENKEYYTNYYKIGMISGLTAMFFIYQYNDYIESVRLWDEEETKLIEQNLRLRKIWCDECKTKK